jgi:cysteine-rich repeat protein
MKRGTLLLLGWLALSGCSSKVTNQGVLVTVANRSGSTGIASLRAYVSNRKDLDQRDHDTLAFPVTSYGTTIKFLATFSITVPADRIGELDIAVDALDSTQTVVANGSTFAVLQPGTFAAASLYLDLGPSPCGNRQIDLGETCDDGNRFSGDGCNYLCQHEGREDAAVGTEVGKGDTASADTRSESLEVGRPADDLLATGGAGGGSDGFPDTDARTPDANVAGGTTASGGVIGVGGSAGAGGSEGTGGIAGTAGAMGTAGSTSPGGTQGGGGAVGSGGTTGSAGWAISGGTVGTGGVGITGGLPDTGGAPGTGGATGTGGTLGAGGTTGSGGMPATGGTTGVGGMPGTGGAATGGASGGGGTTGSGSGGIPTVADMISDFEDDPGNATMVRSGGRTGYWYVYFPGSDSSTAPASGQTISPALNNGRPIATEKDGANNALHFKGSGYGGTDRNFAGVGAAFHPSASNYQISEAYDISAYAGISFKVKSGSGTQPALFFELLTKQNQPLAGGGSATNQKIDLYNTRGQMLVSPWTPNAITSVWQTITIPFGTLVARWVPSSAMCGAAPSVPRCQAAPFSPKDVLGIQISSYQDDGFPKVPGATAGTFDIWIDDVELVKDDSGLQTRAGFPIVNPGSWGSCIKPQGPSMEAKYLVPAFNQWKASFVKGNAVIRPENANDTVSEAIANGMLIAVNMNDRSLFDSLLSYWTSHTIAGSLMTWCIPGAGGSGGMGSSCTDSGGSATGADEDAAFALLMADKVWGGYKAQAMTMISDIWNSDIDTATLLPKGGSNYGSPTGTSGTAITSASYFAPAYYQAFKAAGDGNNWDGVVSAVYTAIGAISGNNGLIPAWCGNRCTAAASTGVLADTNYQYDSHRIPMRLGLDYCWNGQAAAKAYTTKNTAFFAQAAADGIGYVLDMYTPTGGAVSGCAANSGSVLGTSAVGAMATGNQTFLNEAYQAVFDSITRGTMAPVDNLGKTSYSYSNATVGLLTALMLTGSFIH